MLERIAQRTGSTVYCSSYVLQNVPLLQFSMTNTEEWSQISEWCAGGNAFYYLGKAGAVFQADPKSSNKIQLVINLIFYMRETHGQLHSFVSCLFLILVLGLPMNFYPELYNYRKCGQSDPYSSCNFSSFPEQTLQPA